MDYFKEHYKSAFSLKDIEDYQKWFRAQYIFIQKREPFIKSQRILEIGSGLGSFYSLLPEGIAYKGIELDSAATQFATTHFKDANFTTESFEKFTVKSPYDRVIAFEVLEHVENPIQCIEKIHASLKDSGIFMGTSPYPYAKNVFADETHLHVLHPENWKRLFKNAKFKTVETFPMSFFPYLWRIHPALNIRIPFYVPFPQVISTTLIIAKK
jgi:2-polyprenyl-3-methyl-5-hydroxy-6-metoxy-1,4-benzoquinol methylase